MLGFHPQRGIALTFPQMAQRTLHLPDELAARMLMAASRAYPNECCGLIEGADAADGLRATALHEAKNIADDPRRRFLIDPQVQFDLMRRLRGAGTRIIGCFHSHPDGEAAPSATDRAEAYENEFLYLIAGGSPDVFTLKAYLFTDSVGFMPVTISWDE
jgi:proteasome lid subunit RPN8/RPN11